MDSTSQSHWSSLLISVPFATHGVPLPPKAPLLKLPFPIDPNNPNLNSNRHGHFALIESFNYSLEPINRDPKRTWLIKIQGSESGNVILKDPLARYPLAGLDHLPKVLNLLDYRVKEKSKGLATLEKLMKNGYTSLLWNKMHYLLHGCHHKHPMDGLRLVFPPAATTILLVSFSNTVKLFSTPSSTPALFGGGLLGYVIYDCTHYYLHHGQPTNDAPKNLKKYHMNHHFRVQDKGFGITSSLWDRVFGTLPPSKVAKKM
ncbi:hypothetical protein SADUNF_Sadunf16G0024300 [Salix dunnii]|uniref:Fatty acid hydroxylase domain-containing protein n=1 Tax=Salix dunnii TaxID=1413687 RepID=A0A835MKP6_9ROSI|nr:hypothetical protein SADUNF_Sadunf16G0024300 [Salix dunnii]